jgi:hypothetical protein
MSLYEDQQFGRGPSAISPDVLRSILAAQRSTLGSAPWVHCGYEPLPAVDGLRTPVLDVSAPVDNAFRLGPTLGFETSPIIVTRGLRSSRFAAILFWEVLHALAVDGLWIDIDETRRSAEPARGFEDFLQREYFRDCLTAVSAEDREGTLVQTLRKTRETALAPTIDDCGWTFGILTSGPSPQAARMAAAILDLDLPNVEVIFCGPRPAGAPNDRRVSAIDLEPEPRGWVTRKNNLIANRARYDNLCLLHDRFVITPDWADALNEYGQCYSFLTLPQVYYAGVDRQFPQRYPDYQLLVQDRGMQGSLVTSVFDSHRVFCPDYDDFSETAFCCGGLYIARRSLWNLVRQNESLHHHEWEDLSFGLECQRRGLPHRVNPFVVAESVSPHPLALTRLDTIRPSNAERGRLHVTPEQEAAARSRSAVFKPVIASSRDEYYETIRRRFNAMPMLMAEEKLPVDFAAGCSGLADVWAAVDRHVATLRLTTRDEIAQLAFFVADTVDHWRSPEILSWIKGHEEALAAKIRSDRRDLALAPGHSVVGGQRFQPLVDLVAYYSEVERYYPQLFSQTQMQLRMSA